MNKLIITRWNHTLLTALLSGQGIVELGIQETGSILGNIYVGRVSRIVKNLNAAFVEFGEGLTGYYSLTDNPRPLHADGSCAMPKGGDELLIQVERDAVKTKDPVVTSNLCLSGRFAVITAGKRQIGFSSKISGREWKEQMKARLEPILAGQAGIIVRTNGFGQDEALLKETEALLSRLKQILEKARFRRAGSLVWEAEPEFLKSIRSCPGNSLAEIITDDPTVFRLLEAAAPEFDPDHQIRLTLYQDRLIRLASLYSLETALDQACQKRVWMKSGGYLVIEPTEAMTVIDVNTGKYSKGKSQEEAILSINLEAAAEIARQLRLRNLSGIILVDFIDMKDAAHQKRLMEELKARTAGDPVKTTVVDITALNLVEITRKKEKKPLWEQLAQAREEK